MKNTQTSPSWTTIKIDKKTRDILNSKKIILEEPTYKVIRRLLIKHGEIKE